MSEASVNGWEGLEQNIKMLEQILEVMPDDLFTMRALFEASLKLQQPEKAFATLHRLDDLSRSAGNLEMIDYVLVQYASIAEGDGEIQSRVERLKAVKHALTPEAEEAAEEAVDAAAGGGRIEAEMALAWELYQDGVLTQEEYSYVLHDLTEMSGDKMGVPVTVLHILHDRQFSRFDRLMTHLCQKNGVPVIALSQFETPADVIQALPVEFSAINGALPFATVGDDLLLAVLNPMDTELLREAERQSGRRCHPYLVAPEDYDRKLDKSKKGGGS
jgi:hypothetical protein